MCQALTLPWTSARRGLLTMLSSMIERHARSLARFITIRSTASGGRSLQGVLLFRVRWRFLAVEPSGPPGTYPSAPLFLPVKGEDALLDFEVFAAVLIGLAQEHAQGTSEARATC